MAAVLVLKVSTTESEKLMAWREPGDTNILAPSPAGLNSKSPNRALEPTC